MDDARPTQKEIARLTGLAQSTVSMALANNPRVSEKTRKYVHEIASQLKYHPDPYLTALSAYRKRSDSAKYQATLAWVGSDPDNEVWSVIPPFYRHYYEGAVERARELGYRIEEHNLVKGGMTGQRLSKLLWARNIPGVLFAPQAMPGSSLVFDFSHFAAVAFGHTLVSPAIHTVVSHQSKSMLTLLDELQKLGYKRPGLAITHQSDNRTMHNWSSAFWGVQQTLKPENRVPILMVKEMSANVFKVWLKENRPDVVVTEQRYGHAWLVEAGESIPETIGLAIITLRDWQKGYSGIMENSHLIGARALEFLVDLIHRREHGVPEVPTTLMVDGSWVEGTTVRRQVP
ncbi:MAG: LacI family DNA-binding transcriptional regulator [Puniceicoccales bacterium]